MNTQKSVSEMSQEELVEYLRVEEHKDNTIRKVLKLGSLSERLDNNIESCTGITVKNALSQFKNLMLGQFLLGSESAFYIEASYFIGKGKKADYQVSKDYRDYSNHEIACIDLRLVREQINKRVKEELIKSGYTFDIAKNMTALFEEYYNKNLEINKEA